MASIHQLEANRKNAEKCTGPKTPEGKARSSQNALKTGLDAKSEIIRGESREAWESLVAEYYNDYAPATPAERCLVDILVKSEWWLRRYSTVESAIWEREFGIIESDSLGLAFLRQSEAFVRVDRRFNSARRNFDQALMKLRILQAEHAKTSAAETNVAAENAESREALGLHKVATEVREAAADPALPQATVTQPLNPELVSFLISGIPAPLEAPDSPCIAPHQPSNPLIAA